MPRNFGLAPRHPDQQPKETKMIAEIVGPDGKVHYRRSADDKLVEEARKTPGYSVRFIREEDCEPRTAAGSLD